jgi:hypothetical protein
MDDRIRAVGSVRSNKLIAFFRSKSSGSVSLQAAKLHLLVLGGIDDASFWILPSHGSGVLRICGSTTVPLPGSDSECAAVPHQRIAGLVADNYRK